MLDLDDVPDSARARHGRERRRQATHPPRKKPELLATRAGQVWSWDITKLRSPMRGVYYDLYVVIDMADSSHRRNTD